MSDAHPNYLHGHAPGLYTIPAGQGSALAIVMNDRLYVQTIDGDFVDTTRMFHPDMGPLTPATAETPPAAQPSLAERARQAAAILRDLNRHIDIKTGGAVQIERGEWWPVALEEYAKQLDADDSNTRHKLALWLEGHAFHPDGLAHTMLTDPDFRALLTAAEANDRG